jgi:carboxylate-amine ligase
MTAAAAAAAEGVRLCASSTPVLADSGPPVVGDHPRYHAGLAQYRAMLADFMVCSLHVHVHLPDRELAVLVSNHLRPWLPLLVAVSANSPFHQGIDTGYADWRAVIRSRFPCLGPPPYAESLREHEQLAVAMADSGAMLDALTPFWDVRPNPRLPTVEVRTMDVTADIDDTVALAALVRALVATVAERARAGDAGPHPSSELLRAAYWRAARDGWSGCGVDALTGRLIPASVQLAGLVDHVGAALHRHGDTEVVHALDRCRTAARVDGPARHVHRRGRRPCQPDGANVITRTSRRAGCEGSRGRIGDTPCMVRRSSPSSRAPGSLSVVFRIRLPAKSKTELSPPIALRL